MTWVTRAKLQEARGYTPGQVKGRIQRGIWLRGVEFADVDGTRVFNLDAIDARVADRAAAQQESRKRQTSKVVRLQ